MSEEMPKQAIPLNDLAELDRIKANHGVATPRELARELQRKVKESVRPDNLDSPDISVIIEPVREQLTITTLDALESYPPLIQARALYVMAITEKAVVWEASGGVKEVQALGQLGEEHRAKLEETARHLWGIIQGGIVSGECLRQCRSELRRIAVLTGKRAGTPPIPINAVSGWSIACVIKESPPYHHEYLLQPLKIVGRQYKNGDTKIGPKGFVWRHSLIRCLDLLLERKPVADTRRLIATILNEFFAPHPSLKRFTSKDIDNSIHA